MMKSRGGYIVLECILGTLILGSVYLMALQAMTVQRNLGGHQNSKIYANRMAKQYQNNFEGGLAIVSNETQGIFPNGQPYSLSMSLDEISTPPLERVAINISWKDVTTNEFKELERTALRIR